MRRAKPGQQLLAMLKLALAGDTMLGRGVGELLGTDPAKPLLDPAVAAVARGADLFILNLECCISERGAPFPDPHKPFFFRAPPVAAERLAELGVDAVTLANNHALDYGPEALLDTIARLRDVGIASVGAGIDAQAARSPILLERHGFRLRLTAASDHPTEYAAAPGRPGIAYADLRHDATPDWLLAAARPGPDADAVLVSPHWGPNMRAEPAPHVRTAAAELTRAGATLVAGHSAHVFQGAAGRVLFDLGDFVDDYRVDRELRNDLGLLWTVTLTESGPQRIEAWPLALDYAHTRFATDSEHRRVAELLTERGAALGTQVHDSGDRLLVETAG